jgi:hypothetical protein
LNDWKKGSEKYPPAGRLGKFKVFLPYILTGARYNFGRCFSRKAVAPKTVITVK